MRIQCGVAVLVASIVGAGCGGGEPKTTDDGTGSTGAPGTTAETSPGTGGTTGGGATTSESGTGGQTGGMTTAETSPGTTVEPGTTAETSPGTTTTATTAETSGSSGGGGLCDDFVQPGCIHGGCPEGQKCDTSVGCVPSSCGCDPQTGDVICTADCGGGTCVEPVRCEPIVCDLECKFGFKKDMNGCEICECNEGPPECGCESDADCVKASPGCCSCNMGGTEVAVAKACIDQLEKCPVPPDEVVCPAVFKCTDAQAVCVQGACVLQ